jgi:hypothetical protein
MGTVYRETYTKPPRESPGGESTIPEAGSIGLPKSADSVSLPTFARPGWNAGLLFGRPKATEAARSAQVHLPSNEKTR